jgi:preprotein translocase subunit SecG
MIISVLIKVIHFIVCIGLIVVVLLQADKGEGLAGAFGGGSANTVFGDRGTGGIMTKVTTGMAIVFMLTSLVISIWMPKWSEESSGFSAPGTVQTSGSTRLPADLPGLPDAP